MSSSVIFQNLKIIQSISPCVKCVTAQTETSVYLCKITKVNALQRLSSSKW